MKIFILFILLSCLIPLQSCKKFIQVDPPKNQAELSRIFSDDQTAVSATVGLYSQAVAGNLFFCNGGITLYTGLYSDELFNTGTSPVADAFRNNALLVNNSTVLSTFWSNPYKNLYQINAVLEGLTASKNLSASIRSQLEGEMLYMRAFHYFYLANLFGEIPLETATDYTINSKMPRTSLDKVYAQVVSDLTLSRQLLSDNFNASVNTRPSKGAASALLAKVFLYQGKWEMAEAMSTDVISSMKYTLEPLENTFVSTSKETIFQISKQNGNTAEGATFIPSSTGVRPNYALTDDLIAAFEPGDKRKERWTKSNTVAGIQYYYPFKYKVRSTTPISEFYIVQRLSEVYLIRAEARAEQNNVSGAIEDVDMVRSRAGLFTSLLKDREPSIDQEGIKSAILRERQTELFAEWGNRFFDLKRLGKADSVLGERKSPNWQPTDKRFPIPYLEILNNSSLAQNEGYVN